ncbi:MAG: ATP phosphoribosyltransferase regulatory subunit [Halorhodospira sp.]
MDWKAHWMLPEGVDELLPPEAAQAEGLRRRLLDLYQGWGYELIMPPFIEYLTALLTGNGRDLDVQTFKVTDQVSGRTLGVRPDITPQAARIDAHQLRREGITRLCYIGSTLQARAEGPAGSRNAVQLGAELYGHAGMESDLEIISLMLASLRCAGMEGLHLDIGHVGIFRALISEMGLDGTTEEALFDALQRKAEDEILAVLREAGVEQAQAERLGALARLHGGVEVLERAQTVLGWAGSAVAAALAELQAVAESLQRREPDVALHFDLGELRGYRYHTGLVFAAYTPGYGRELARGGRYDGIGAAFGRQRPATGYSADLKALLALAGDFDKPACGGVLAPWGDDLALLRRVAELRRAGERVVWQLPGDAEHHGCERRLVARNGTWELE